jgi:hypothetical protein
MGEYEIRNVRGHIEVYRDGDFQFSADTRREAREEVEEREARHEDV